MKFLSGFVLIFCASAINADVKDEDRIVGGQIADPNSIPFQAALIVRRASGPNLCGGSLLDDKTILTAAHCLKGSDGALVILGGHDLTANETGVVKRMVPASNYRIHPHFNLISAYLDLALIKISTPVKFSKSIQPVKLPFGILSAQKFADEIGTVSGFGQYCDTCGSSKLLRYTQNLILSNDECSNFFDYSAIPSDTQICVSTLDMKNGNCRGDSGGPLTVTRDGNVYQIGISSFGYRKCEEGKPTVFTRLTSDLISWINESIHD